MAKISTYGNDFSPQFLDKVIGTSISGPPDDNTANFSFEDILNLFLPEITLQTVLNAGNSATQNINLAGNISLSGNINAQGYILSYVGFVVDGGTSSQFLKANGSVDSNTYLTTSSASTTYAPISGSVNYIQNQYAVTQTANFKINGTGALGILNIGSATMTIDNEYGQFYIGNQDSSFYLGDSTSLNAMNDMNIYGAQALYLTCGTSEINYIGTYHYFNSKIIAATNLLVSTGIDDGINKLQVNGSIKATQYRLAALNTAPASATATGTLGEIRYTSDYIYVCVATNTWKRTQLTSW